MEVAVRWRESETWSAAVGPAKSEGPGEQAPTPHWQARRLSRCRCCCRCDATQGPAVAVMIDRLVHHADVITLKGDSQRLKSRELGRPPAATTD